MDLVHQRNLQPHLFVNGLTRRAGKTVRPGAEAG